MSPAAAGERRTASRAALAAFQIVWAPRLLVSQGQVVGEVSLPPGMFGVAAPGHAEGRPCAVDSGVEVRSLPGFVVLS